MDRIAIDTGMAGFHLLSSVTRADDTRIRGRAVFADQPSFVVMEALAQLGALHVRRLLDFSSHAFLLKVEACSLPLQERISGSLALSGTQAARSQAAFSYDLVAEMENESFSGRFVFSVTAYDDRFPEAILRKRYKEVFACLTSGSGIG